MTSEILDERRILLSFTEPDLDAVRRHAECMQRPSVGKERKVMFIQVEFARTRAFSPTTPVLLKDKIFDRYVKVDNLRIPGGGVADCKPGEPCRYEMTSLKLLGRLTHEVIVSFEPGDWPYQRKQYMRIRTLLSDGTLLEQEQVYAPWGASAEDCDINSEYLQTHYFNSADDENLIRDLGELKCQPCPYGGTCTGSFVTFEHVRARQGFSRMSWNRSIFGKCPIAVACEGVPDELHDVTGEYLSVGNLKKYYDLVTADNVSYYSYTAPEQCRNGHLSSSELCNVCEPGQFVSQMAQPPGICGPCPNASTNWAMFGGLLFAAALYLAFLIYDNVDGAEQIIGTTPECHFTRSLFAS